MIRPSRPRPCGRGPIASRSAWVDMPLVMKRWIRSSGPDDAERGVARSDERADALDDELQRRPRRRGARRSPGPPRPRRSAPPHRATRRVSVVEARRASHAREPSSVRMTVGTSGPCGRAERHLPGTVPPAILSTWTTCLLRQRPRRGRQRAACRAAGFLRARSPRRRRHRRGDACRLRAGRRPADVDLPAGDRRRTAAGCRAPRASPSADPSHDASHASAPPSAGVAGWTTTPNARRRRQAVPRRRGRDPAPRQPAAGATHRRGHQGLRADDRRDRAPDRRPEGSRSTRSATTAPGPGRG